MTDQYDLKKESFPRWFELADRHLKAANLLADSSPQHAAFWYHQAAERYLKAFLINHEIAFSNSVTNLRELIELCHENSGDLFRVAVKFSELDLMSTWETAFQYPPEPGEQEVAVPNSSMLLAARTICAMLQDLAAR
jgi:HEPN domain-containing protein